MELNILIENAQRRVDALKDGIGKKEAELISAGMPERDALLVSSAKEVGEITKTDTGLKATGLCASMLSEAFLNLTDDESEYVFEQAVGKKEDMRNQSAYHFIQFFDEDEWHCYYTEMTSEVATKILSIELFEIKEVLIEGEVTDNLRELTDYVHSTDKRFTENYAKHILDNYEFASGGRNFVANY